MDLVSGRKECGTFKAVMRKIKYLKELGITSLLFMPVYEFEEMNIPPKVEIPEYAKNKTKIAQKTDEMVQKTDKVNMWGYGDGSYFAVKASYAYDPKNAASEFKSLVKKLHENNMECIMEMHFMDTANHNLIIEALRFWVKEYHVDGFKLIGDNLPVTAIVQDLLLSRTKILYENFDLSSVPDGRTCENLYIDKEEYMYPARKVLNHMNADMKELLEIVVLGRACRNTANIKNRQPIGTMYVKAEKKMSEFYTDIIADELNVKEVKFADDVESFISYSFKPQLRTVGPKYGKLLGGIRQALTDINGTAAMNELRTNGVLKLDINGNDVELTEEDLLIETAQTEGYVSESDGETSVVLDTNLTPELIEEGFVREIISKIQTMRKEAGFEVMDKIVVYAHGNDKIQDVMKAHEDEIKSEVLADEMVLGETDGYVKEWNINKEAVTMGVKKL